MANLIREDDTAVYGDKGYASDEKRRAAEAEGVTWAVKEKAKPGHVVKCQFGYLKVRYRGIVKNGAQVFALFALANLYLARGRLASA